MHAYLIVSSDHKNTDKQIAKIKKRYHLQTNEFVFNKIQDAKDIKRFTKFGFSKASAIILRDVDLTTIEAQNAFLKNLEEPTKNLTYILTCKRLSGVLPTIVSRCTVIKLKSSPQTPSSEAEKILKMPLGKKIIYLTAIKDRQQAIQTCLDLTVYLHQQLTRDDNDTIKTALLLNAVENTHQAIAGNGQLLVQLANLAIKLS